MLDNYLSLPITRTVNRYPIYIPSKGRASRDITAKALRESNLDYTIVVEPQDYESYLQTFPKEQLFCMDKDDQGQSYVRNVCREHSISIGAKYHWQFDDNIHNFALRENGKTKKCLASRCILPMEDVVDEYSNIGIVGLCHTAFAFAKIRDYDLNKQIYTGFLVNNSVPVSFRLDTVEDTDFSLQILSSGYCTVMFNRFIMNKATTMTMSGGNTDSEARDERALLRHHNLQSAWPEAKFQIHHDGKKYRMKPSRVWNTFTQKPLLNTEHVATIESFMED